jgi:small-conductance mechanosensitive channel
LETTITVRYDTPEKKVQNVLQLAAHRTIGVSKASSPIVVQIAQSDSYRKYRLTCQATPTKFLTRTILLSDLHANVQDALKEYGVQLQSHYFGTPQSSFSVTDVVRY